MSGDGREETGSSCELADVREHLRDADRVGIFHRSAAINVAGSFWGHRPCLHLSGVGRLWKAAIALTIQVALDDLLTTS